MSSDTEKANGALGPSALGRPPEFFLAGHPKSGTTAMYDALRHIPGIYLPDFKEPMYLATDLPMSRFQPQTMKEYLALFAPAGSGELIGDASSLYLLSHTAAANIASLNARAKAIVILREPISFLVAFHAQLQRAESGRAERVRRFEQALERDADGPPALERDKEERLLAYRDHVRYSQQLERLNRALPEGQVLVLIYDDWRSDPQGELDRVVKFLGVAPPRDEVAVSAANRSYAPRLPWLEGQLAALEVGRGSVRSWLRKGIVTATPRVVRRQAVRVTREHVLGGRIRQPSPACISRLRRELLPEVERLSEDLSRDLISLWNYR